MPQIRPIAPRDDQQMKKILQQCLTEAGLNVPGTAYFDPQLDELAEYYARLERSAYWVVVDAADRVLGGCGYGPVADFPAICELQKLYLAPAARGQGLSKVLVNKAMAAAKQSGYAQMYVVTDTKLPIANLLYQKMGFARLPQALADDPHDGCDTWYLKDL